jgi:Glycosyl hydrolases family 16
MPTSLRSTRALVLTLAVVVALCTSSSTGLPLAASAMPMLTSARDSGTTVSATGAVSSDDAEESAANGSMDLTSSDLELMNDPSTWPGPGTQVVGVRFAGLNVPRDATITAASIEFTVDETAWTDLTSLTLQAEATDNASTFTNVRYDISSRPRTASSVVWSAPPVWATAGAQVRTPDLSPIIQEVVNRDGWAGGNALSVIVTGTGHRTAWASDGSAEGAPVLVVTYTAPSAPAADTAAPAPATAAAGPSGQPMPVGDLPGWHQIFAEDFTTNAALGSFTSVYGSRWSVYLDGWPDTSGKNSGTKSGYYPSKVLSVSNGLLNEFLHVENGTHMAAAILPILPGKSSGSQGQLYGKYTVRFRSDPLHDLKTAWLLWPDNEVWPGSGEIDFPEGRLDKTIGAFLHRQGARTEDDQDAFTTGTTYTGWHTASIEWLPTTTNFILDDKVILSSTSRIPNTRMHYVLQTESCLDCTYNNVGGNLQIDWVVVYAPAN